MEGKQGKRGMEKQTEEKSCVAHTRDSGSKGTDSGSRLIPERLIAIVERVINRLSRILILDERITLLAT